MKNFESNEHGVVLNPNVAFFYQVPNRLAIDYIELTAGICANGLWDFGYHLPGESSPCSFGRFETEEEAIHAAITRVSKGLAAKTGFAAAAYLSEAKSRFKQYAASFYSRQVHLNSEFQVAGVQLALF